MTRSRTLACAVTGLVAIFAANCASAIDRHASADGRFQQCVSASEFLKTLNELNQSSIAAWDSHKDSHSGRGTVLVHEILTADTIHPDREKRWIGWTRLDNNADSDYCLNASGIGMIILNRSIPESLPKRPFGILYTAPANADMGNGSSFINNYVAGNKLLGYNPVVLLRTGEKTFGSIYTTATGEVVVGDTKQNGSTQDTTIASNFKFAPSIELGFRVRR